MKKTAQVFFINLALYVLATLAFRGWDFFNTLDEERIRWSLAIIILAAVVALLPKKKDRN